MPATEQTCYNMRRLHKVFAVSSVLLTAVTIWMFAHDHYRPWKSLQRTSDQIEMQLTRWQKLQTLSEDAVAEREWLEQSLAETLARPFPEGLIAEFRQEVTADAERRHVAGPSFGELEQAVAELDQVAASSLVARQAWQAARLKSDKARLDVEDAAVRARDAEGDVAVGLQQVARDMAEARRQAKLEVEQAAADKRQSEDAVEPLRAQVLAVLELFVSEARFREEELLRVRKVQLAELDVKKAELGFGVRDQQPDSLLKQLQDEIEQRQQRIVQVTLDAEAAAEHRQRLRVLLDQMTESEVAIRRRLDEMQVDVKRLDQLLAEKQSTYFRFWGILPVPGKKWLELPILDAFNSPRKIENLWSEGLDRESGSFGRVRRFDRCTTCHRNEQKALPDRPDQPALRESIIIDFALQLPSERTKANDDAGAADDARNRQEKLKQFLGLQLAPTGLLHPHDVTIQYVRPRSPAREARRYDGVGKVLRAGDLRDQLFFAAQSEDAAGSSWTGLRLGDVIVAIDHRSVPADGTARQWVAERLVDAVTENWAALRQDADPRLPVHLRVRRGLPHPYAGHPRLDLFVGTTSAHKMADFGCTVCHEGQGSATAFKWASHAPNDVRARQRWKDEYGWFDNPHWTAPMYPRRFVESSCLKCHHDVVELERSEKYDNPPAPTVSAGYRLIRTLGCYGCHEISGFRNPGQRVGPDLRLEPNYFAAALQFKGAAGTGYDRLTEEEKTHVAQLIQSPEDDSVREYVCNMLAEDARKTTRTAEETIVTSAEEGEMTAGDEAESPRFSDDVHQTLMPLLKRQETPGTLRKAGPSLRFVGHKLDDAFVSDWIRQPTHFRPSTRMPQAFGLWNHLPGRQLRGRRAALQGQLRQLRDAPSGRSRRVRQIEMDLAAVDAELARVDEVEKRFEPVVIYSMMRYLRARSQALSHLESPPGITPVVTEADKQAQIARGKIAFQQRGCLACHDHVDFPDVTPYRPAEDIVPGPDLSDLAAKFAPQRSPEGARWLFSWITQPTRYDVRTTMPDLALTPVQHCDAAGNLTSVTDPAADIVSYLMSGPQGDWQPSGDVLSELDVAGQQVLQELSLTYLRDMFPEATARRYVRQGIPSAQRHQIGGAERELLIPADEQDVLSEAEMMRRRLFYVARKAFTTSGCYACHDIPGMEDAKPIGPGLNDWGRKNTVQLAFAQVQQYVQQAEDQADAPPAASAPYYRQQLAAHSRIGFVYQKLKEPRSFDYYETRNKKYTERLRMPQFSLTVPEREAIITFVLGLVADPPSPKYVYTPDAHTMALMAGRELMTKYSCRSCHIVEPEKWDIAFPPDYYGTQTTQPTYPFVVQRFSRKELDRSRVPDDRGLRNAQLEGMPAVSDDGLPLILDEEEFPIEEEADEEFEIDRLIYTFDLWKPAILDGQAYQVGEGSLDIWAQHIRQRRRSYGGALTRYLLPQVVQHEKTANPNAKGAEAWAWLPPPLLGEGRKVQSDWLYGYLLQPHSIRPAAVMRMPRYNLSSQEARQLVDYFAAKDRALYPYELEPVRQADHLAAADQRYTQTLQQVGEERSLQLDETHHNRHLTDAMKVVTNGNYCVKCHLIGDYIPAGTDRVMAPDLTAVHNRLRGEYVRQWLAKPASIAPYTSMPVNIPFDPDARLMGTTVPQQLYHGTSMEQLDALIDLLMNFDRYTRERSPVTPMVE